MSEQHDSPEEERPDAEAEGPRAGERLAEARRARQIPVAEIAKELHLDERKVRALERNDFDVLGAPVFAKGHLKKYAELVGVDKDDVIADYYRLTRSATIPPVLAGRRVPRRRVSPGPWIAFFVIVLLVALAYWLVVERPFAAPEAVSEPQPVAIPEAALAPADDAPTADTGGTAPFEAPSRADVEAEPPATSEAEVPSPASGSAIDVPLDAIADNEVRLTVRFLGDCWTEITDATGARLYFNLGRLGQTINVSGQAPLSVLFGDADNVELRVNGSEFTIADADRRGRTARLMLYGTES